MKIQFISGQQKGLIDVVARHFGHVRHFHTFCFRHLHKNMTIKFLGAYLEELIWRAAKSYNETDYKFWMDQVEELNPAAIIYLESHPLDECIRNKYDHTSKSSCNNIWLLIFAENYWINVYEYHQSPAEKHSESEKRHLMLRPRYPQIYYQSQMPDMSETIGIVDGTWEVGIWLIGSQRVAIGLHGSLKY